MGGHRIDALESLVPPIAAAVVTPQKFSTKCHVWTAPAVQEESDAFAMVGCGHVFGLIAAATLAAGHDVIRGSGPNQKHALVSRVALGGFSRSNGSTVSHHVVFTPAIRER